jgi:type VI secretion system secreted protein Hcp
MAVDIFLKLDTIQGDSQDSVHKGEIDVLSWDWGVTQGGGGHSGPGSGTGKAQVADLVITKNSDRSSPLLFTMSCSGTPIKTGLLTLRKAGGTPLEFLKITMNQILISKVSKTIAAGGDAIVETISMNFASFTYEYVPQNADGTGAASIVKGFNIASNLAS